VDYITHLAPSSDNFLQILLRKYDASSDTSDKLARKIEHANLIQQDPELNPHRDPYQTLQWDPLKKWLDPQLCLKAPR
jgi:hypothetical protein